MSKLEWKGGTLLAPVPPALVTCGNMEKPNVLTVAWTGILCSDPPKTYVSVRPTRYSYGLIKESGEFVINVPTVPLARAVDTCGVYSGKDKNKFELCSLTPEKGFQVAAPTIAESPLSLECRVTDTVDLGSHTMFIADILCVDVDETLVDEAGKLCLEKVKLLAYSHGEYYELGKKLGNFGWSVKKKHTGKRK